MSPSDRQPKTSKSRPPRLTRWALGRLLPANIRDWTIGDLDEEFHCHALPSLGRRRARGWYRREALSLLSGFARQRRRADSRKPAPTRKGDPFMQTFFQDVRFALRGFARQPVFTVATLLTLALGIGAVSAIFSLVDTVVLKPFPYPSPHQIVVPSATNAQRGLDRTTVAYPDYLDWRREGDLFQQMALIFRNSRDLAGDGEPVRIEGLGITQDYFPLMRARPLLGRLFHPQEFAQDAGDVMVLSTGLWQSRFGADPSVLGKSVEMSGRQVQVVGVLDPQTVWPSDVQFWRPVYLPDPPTPFLLRRDNFAYRAVGRLQPGVSLEQAQARVTALAQISAQEYPDLRQGWGVRLYRLDDWIVRPQVRLALWILLGAVGLVLLIACVNVANLLLARAASREREMGIRMALGAGRRRLLRQLLTESLTLSAGGALLGLLFCWAGIRFLTAFPQDIPRLAEARIDLSVLFFAAGVSVLTALAFGTFPALRASRNEPACGLKEAVPTVTGSGSSKRFQGLLVCAEVCLSLTLLIAAGLFLQSFSRLYNAQPGIRTDNVLTLVTALSSGRYPEKADEDTFFEQVLARLEQLPDIESAAAASSLPLGGGGINLTRAHLEDGAPQPPSGPEYSAFWNVVSDDYFRCLAVPVLQGRSFDKRDQSQSVPVIVINQAMARSMFGTEDPLGKRIRSWRDEDLLREVVGVVGDVRHFGMDDSNRPMVYVSYRQIPWRGLQGLVLHTRNDPLEAVKAVRALIWDIDPKLPITQVRSMEEILQQSMDTRQFLSGLILVFAVCAVLLATVGIYGVVSFIAGLRKQEIGIRMALGAKAGNVLGMILGHGMALATIGIGAGIVLSLALSRAARSLLYEVSPSEPSVYVAGALLLAAITCAASLIPAWRASKIDPLRTLRSD